VPIGEIQQINAVGAPAPPPAIDLKAPFNMLVVGTDDLPGPGRDAGGRGDSMIIVHVDMQANVIRMASLPRDLLVTLADGSGQDRLNVAIQRSPDVLIRTVNQTFGIPIDHFVLVNGAGLAALVDVIGGVPMDVAHAVRDANTGLDLTAGCHVLSGDQTLALSRSRHLEVQQANGRFAMDATSDLGRERRQQLVGEAIVRQAGRHGAAVGGFTELAQVATDEMVLDDHLGISDLIGLARWSQGLGTDAVKGTIPTVTDRTTPQGAAVLELAPGSAAAVRQFLTAPVGANPGSTVPGSTTPGSTVPGPAASSTTVPSSMTAEALLSQPITAHPAATC